MATLHWHKWKKDKWGESDEKDNAGRKKRLAEISRDCFEVRWQLLFAVFLLCFNVSFHYVKMVKSKETDEQTYPTKG